MDKNEKSTQKDTNPFIYSETNKRYHTYDHYMKKLFGCKCYKVPVDAGFCCPNTDGARGYGGCIYCACGSRSVITDPSLTPYEQYVSESAVYRKKDGRCKFIVYFQSYSCTYAPVERLAALYNEAARYPDAVGIAIGTRADCIDKEKAAYLAELSEKTHLTVELGLQTVSDKTASLINRCHTFEEFKEGYYTLRRAGGKIRIGIHVISGLPGESAEDELKTAAEVAKLRPDEVKIHLLHVLRGTKLADMYEKGGYVPIARDEYIKRVCSFLELLPPETVIGRLTGDGDRDLLIAPGYSKDKKKIINGIDKYLFENDTYQGRLYVQKETELTYG